MFSVSRRSILTIFLATSASLSLHTQATQKLNETLCLNPDLNIPISECEALVELYNSTEGENWNNSNWGNQDVSTWHGISLSTEAAGEKQQVIAISLSNNNLTGTIPASLATLSASLDLSHNNLSGRIPNEFKNYKYPIQISNNKINGNILEILGKEECRTNIHDGESFRSLYPQYSSYKQQSNSGGVLLEISKSSDHQHFEALYKVIPDEGFRLSEISGCPNGRLEQGLFTVPQNTQLCSISAHFTPCKDTHSCTLNTSNTGSIPNTHLETPHPTKLNSGVLQLRGWVYQPILRRSPTCPTDATPAPSNINPSIKLQIDDNPPTRIFINGLRADVTAAMKVKDNNEFSKMGWNLLFYAGSLENGKHRIKIFNDDGIKLIDDSFKTYTPNSQPSKHEYIKTTDLADNTPTSLFVENFPNQGDKVKLEFNQAEQAFSIIDQFDKDGISLRSTQKHFKDDTEISNNAPTYTPAVIENPKEGGVAQLITGVGSLRGWEFYARSPSNSYLIIDDDIKISVSGVRRQDVENSLNSTDVRGWSSLFYSGQLKNGFHRLRFYAPPSDAQSHLGFTEDEPPVLQSETVFETFSPTNSSGEVIYVKGKNTQTTLENFPYPGSKVKLAFDQASQSFKIIGQTIP